jgi:NAD(P)-dependent dehydrogenase (short-subunit alcohol dehydrogenase family)
MTQVPGGTVDRFRLDGRVAVVTGGAGNAGRAIARELAQAGASVVVASRNGERCRAFAQELAREGLPAHGYPLDLADERSVEALADEVLARFGRFDVLVNNAVSWVAGHVERLPLADWEAAMRVDGGGFFHLSQVALRHFLEAGSGVFVNIASVLGMVSPDASLYPQGIEGFRPNYFFAKAGMIGFTRFLAVSYADRGVRANCVSPGGIDQADRPAQGTGGWASRTPMRRRAVPEEVADAVRFLACDASSYITGHNLVVDGGYTAW